MVHRGPSKGCNKCKARHTKCDLTRPSCLKCTKKSIKCPGYGHQLDPLIRDETSKFRRLYVDNAAKRIQLIPAITCPVLPFTNLAIEEGARGWFFTNIFSEHRDWRASHGHFDIVLRLFKSSATGSLLALTVNWLAVLMIGASIRGRPYALEHELLAMVIRLLNDSISDQFWRRDEHTLLVMILLQFGEEIRARRYSSTPIQFIGHQNMAEVLVSQALYDTKSRISQSLVAAVRHNALLYSFLDISRKFDSKLWCSCSSLLMTPDGHDETPAMRLDAYGVELLALRNTTDTQEDDLGREQRWLQREKRGFECLQILGKLRLWEETVPCDWKPQIYGRFCHVYPSVEVCYIYAQCFWLQLTALHLASGRRVSQGAFDQGFEQQILGLFDKIIALECSFVVGNNLRKECVMSQLHDLSEPLPCVTIFQCRQSVIGSRFLDLTLRIFDKLLSRFTNHDLTESVIQRSWICKAWISRELHIIRQAFPVARDCRSSSCSQAKYTMIGPTTSISLSLPSMETTDQQ